MTELGIDPGKTDQVMLEYLQQNHVSKAEIHRRAFDSVMEHKAKLKNCEELKLKGYSDT
jgi:hypothetical protein